MSDDEFDMGISSDSESPNSEEEQQYGYKKRSRLTKEQEIYGIWADDEDIPSQKRNYDSSDEDNYERKPSRFVPSNASRSKTTPSLVFVKSEKTINKNKSTFDKIHISDEDESEMLTSHNDVDTLKKRNGTVAPSTSRTQHEKAYSIKTKKTSNGTTSAPPVNIMSTYGKGASLLMKMGYQQGQGLGKAKQGIVEPIEVKLREKGRGLSYGTKERPDEPPSRDDRASRDASSMHRPHADDLVDEPRQSFPSRHTNAKKITKHNKKGTTLLPSENVTVVDASMMASSPSYLVELTHNVNLLHELASVRTVHQSRQLQQTQATLQQFNEQRISVTSDLHQIHLDLEALLKSIHAWNDLNKSSSANEHTITQFLESLSLNEGRRRPVCQEMASQVMLDYLNRALSDWSLDQQPEQHALLLERWSSHLLRPSSNGHSGEPTLYEKILYHRWLPKVKHYVSNEFRVFDLTDGSLAIHPSNDVMIRMLYAYSPLLPSYLYMLVIKEWLNVLIAHLRADYRWSLDDSLCLNSVMEMIDSLLDVTTRDMVMRCCGHQDDLVLEAVQQSLQQPLIVCWEEILKREFTAEQLMTDRQRIRAYLQSAGHRMKGIPVDAIYKHIRQVLTNHMKVHFVVDPRQQSLKVLDDVMPWHDVIHFDMMDVFVVKWITALYYWLKGTPDYEEVANWYEGWKKKMKPYHVDDFYFQQALLLIEKSMDQMPLPDLRSVLEDLTLTVSQKNRPALQKTHPLVSSLSVPATYTYSIKELTAEWANERNLLFMPTHQKTDSQKPVYRLGTSTMIYFDQDVIYLLKGQTPVSLEELSDICT